MIGVKAPTVDKIMRARTTTLTVISVVVEDSGNVGVEDGSTVGVEDCRTIGVEGTGSAEHNKYFELYSIPYN